MLPSLPPPAPPIPWSSLAVRTSGRTSSATRDLTGPPRLALLYLWYRDDRPPRFLSAEVAFHPVRGAPLASPRAVDWSGFPWADAVSAVPGLNVRRG